MRSSGLTIMVAVGLCLASIVAQASGSSGPGFSNLGLRRRVQLWQIGDLRRTRM